MKRMMLLLAGAALMSTTALAGDGRQDKCKDCEEPTKEVCFNAYCSYERENGTRYGYRRCEAASIFNKDVTISGEEIHDKSNYGNTPDLEVSCDGRTLFNNSANRYTDHLGTRLQAFSGPYPSVLLPRKALRERHGYVQSVLELNGQILNGYCYLYTGQP